MINYNDTFLIDYSCYNDLSRGERKLTERTSAWEAKAKKAANMSNISPWMRPEIYSHNLSAVANRGMHRFGRKKKTPNEKNAEWKNIKSAINAVSAQAIHV